MPEIHTYFLELTDLEKLMQDMKDCHDLMHAIEVKLEPNPRRGAREMLWRKLTKVESQVKQLILDLAALRTHAPASRQLKQKVSILLYEIEQDLKEMFTKGCGCIV